MSRLKIINLTIFLCFIQVLNSIWIGPYMMYLSMVQWTYPAKDIIGETGCYLMNILRGMHLHEVQLQSFFISLFRFTCLYYGHFLQKISPNVSIKHGFRSRRLKKGVADRHPLLYKQNS